MSQDAVWLGAAFKCVTHSAETHILFGEATNPALRCHCPPPRLDSYPPSFIQLAIVFWKQTQLQTKSSLLLYRREVHLYTMELALPATYKTAALAPALSIGLFRTLT